MNPDKQHEAKRIRHPLPDTPQCQRPFVREVAPNGYPLPSWFAQRDAKLVRKGFDPAFCGLRSSWRIDGGHYCSRHAGVVALEILTERGDATETREEGRD